MRKWAALICFLLICTASCVMAETCTHPNAQEEGTWDRYHYEQIDDWNVHLLQYVTVQTMYCPDCMMPFDGEILEVLSEELIGHRYDENDVCQDCGLVFACPHEELYSDGFWQYDDHYEQISDPKYHLFVCDRYEHIKCSSCYRLIEKTFMETHTSKWVHLWNEENVCVDCGQVNDCTHPEYETVSVQRNIRREQTGDLLTHDYVYDAYEYPRCTRCALKGEETLVQLEIRTPEEHRWNDENVCRNCGQVNVCTHENITYSASYTNFRREPKAELDLRYHLYLYDQVSYADCDDCGVRISEESYGTQSEDESHYWTEENVCWYCGQENTCAHENTEDGWTKRNYRNEQYNAGYHYWMADHVVFTDCLDCGARVYEAVDYVDKSLERHDWNDEGVCQACDYVNVCTHEQVTEDYYSDEEAYTYVDSRTHIVHNAYSIETVCVDCGVELGVRDAGIFDTLGEHWWLENGYCYACDGENLCTHEGMESYTYLYEEYEDLEDGVSHRVTQYTYGYKTCPICGYESPEEELIDEQTKIEPHTDPYWCNCGWFTECPHEETYAVTGYKYDHVEYKDEDKHTRFGYLRTRVFCEMCDEVLESEVAQELTAYEEEWHRWSNDGRCYSCDAENLCTHAQKSVYTYVMEYAGSYTPVNAQLHEGEQVVCEKTVCSVCGADVGRIDDMRMETVFEPHDFSETGYCYGCGMRNACAHDGGAYEEKDVWEWDSCDVVDENTHIMAGTFAVWEYCRLCDQQLSMTITGYEECEQPHVMSGSECETCGYTVDCMHKNAVRMDVTRWEYECRYVPVSETEHDCMVEIWNVPVCPDCDVQLWEERAFQTGEQDVREAHEMISGVCMQCGYEEGSPVEYHLELPADLTAIEAEAFRGNAMITHVIVPDGVTQIGNYAFADCASLVSVSLPAGVAMGEGVFDGCENVQVTIR